MLARCPHCPQCPHRKCAGFDGTPYAFGSGWRSNGHGCQHLRRIFAPAAARLPWRIAVRWPAGSRARLRYRLACTRTGRSVPGFHRHGQTLSLQSFHQTLDVLGLEACCSHVPVAEFLKLACATRSSRHSRSRWVAQMPSRCAGTAASAQISGLAFVVFLLLILLSASCPGVSVRCRWCVDVR